MKTVAIVAAAGQGKRLGSKVKKPFVLLGGKPLVYYSVAALDSCDSIDAIIIAAERSSLRRFKNLVRRARFKKVVDVIVGGKTRFESVRNALRNLGPGCGIVLIHDGARPFLTDPLIRDSIRTARRYGGAIAAVPESDTVKLADKNLFITRTLDRKRVFRAQTPQAFRFDLIKKAYGLAGRVNVTDDSSLVELSGGRVKIITGSYRNIKITTKEDLKIAEVLLKYR